MYYTNAATTAALIADTRTFRSALVFADGRVCTGDTVGRWTAGHALTTDDTLQIGAVLARRAEITLHDAAWIPAKGDCFRLYLWPTDLDGSVSPGVCTHRVLSLFTHAQLAAGADLPIGGELIPMGRYFVRRVRVSAHTAQLIAYDGLQAAADTPYTTDLTFPAASDAVMSDIAAKLGLAGTVGQGAGHLRTSAREYVLTSDGERVRVSANYRFTITEKPEGSCADVLGHIAAVYGGNAITDREGRLTTRFYTAGQTSGLNETHIDDPEVADEDVYVSTLICTVSDDTTYTGTISGTVRNARPLTIETVSPYMTKARFDDLCSELRHENLIWRPADLRWRLGDPRHDLGDRPNGVPYWDASGHERRCGILITDITYDFDGGLMCDISSAGDTGGDL